MFWWGQRKPGWLGSSWLSEEDIVGSASPVTPISVTACQQQRNTPSASKMRLVPNRLSSMLLTAPTCGVYSQFWGKAKTTLPLAPVRYGGLGVEKTDTGKMVVLMW